MADTSAPSGLAPSVPGASADEKRREFKKQQSVSEDGTNDEEFKKGFSQEVLARTTTLKLKASFHLINYIMMSVCDVMIKFQKAGAAEDVASLPDQTTQLNDLEDLAQEAKVTKLSPYKFMVEHEERCMYKVKQESSYDIKITECAPKLFQSIRK